MVQTRGRPAPSEWEQIKPELKHKYLTQNLTLNVIRKQFAERGFIATERQYKTKVKAWGFDNKTTKYPVYHSMYVVMKNRQQLGLTSVFIVPIRGGDFNVVRPDKIVKEKNRNRVAFDSSNLRQAEIILQRNGVEVCNDDDQEILHILHTLQWTDPSEVSEADYPPQWQASSSRARRASDSLNDSLSPLTDQNTPTMAAAEPSSTVSGQFPHSESPTSPSGTSLGWTSEAVFPLPNETVVNSPCNVNSTTTSWPVVGIDEPNTIAVMSSLFVDPLRGRLNQAMSPHGTPSGSTQRYTTDQEDEKQLAVRWTAPYLQGFLRRNTSQSQVDWHGRHSAKDAFRSMLKRNNRYIFPYCHWMTIVLASNNQTALLTEFLTDCCEALNCDETDYRLTYGSPLHLTLALYNENNEEIELHCEAFISSIAAIRLIWGEESPNHLVNQHYYAWLMLERKQHNVAVQILVQCLPIAMRVMGDKHAVTISCLSILARAYAELNREVDAIKTYQDALDRLIDCDEFLQAYRHRQMIRLAELQWKTGMFEHAEINIRAVLTFRIGQFGIVSDATWEAIRRLAEFLASQGRQNESDHLMNQYTNQYYERADEERRKRNTTPAAGPAQA